MSEETKRRKKNFGFAKDQLRYSFIPIFVNSFLNKKISVPYETQRGMGLYIQEQVTNGLGYNRIRSDSEFERGQMHGETEVDLVRHLGEMEQTNSLLNSSIFSGAAFYVMEYLSSCEKAHNTLWDMVESYQEDVHLMQGKEMRLIEDFGLSNHICIRPMGEEEKKNLIEKGKMYFAEIKNYPKCGEEKESPNIEEKVKLSDEEFKEINKDLNNVERILKGSKKNSPKKRKRQGIRHWFY